MNHVDLMMKLKEKDIATAKVVRGYSPWIPGKEQSLVLPESGEIDIDREVYIYKHSDEEE